MPHEVFEVTMYAVLALIVTSPVIALTIAWGFRWGWRGPAMVGLALALLFGVPAVLILFAKGTADAGNEPLPREGVLVYAAAGSLLLADIGAVLALVATGFRRRAAPQQVMRGHEPMADGQPPTAASPS